MLDSVTLFAIVRCGFVPEVHDTHGQLKQAYTGICCTSIRSFEIADVSHSTTMHERCDCTD